MLALDEAEARAALAYEGHSRAVASPVHRDELAQIARDEWHHREVLLPDLTARGLRPWWFLELWFWLMGSAIGFGCRIWGEWASAKGAAWFEINGVAEYTRLAQLARRLGDEDYAIRMEAMAEKEAEHRAYFEALARACWSGEGGSS